MPSLAPALQFAHPSDLPATPPTPQGYIKYAQRVAWLGFRPTIPQHLPPALQELIAACWSQDPLKRPSFSSIISKLEGIREALRRMDMRQQRQQQAGALPTSTLSVAPAAVAADHSGRGGAGGGAGGAGLGGGCGGVVGLAGLGLGGMEGCLPVLLGALLPGRALGRAL